MAKLTMEFLSVHLKGREVLPAIHMDRAREVGVLAVTFTQLHYSGWPVLELTINYCLSFPFSHQLLFIFLTENLLDDQR